MHVLGPEAHPRSGFRACLDAAAPREERRAGVPRAVCRARAQVRPACVLPLAGQILGFGAELGAEHPGFADPEYKQRRMDICATARTHQV